MTAVFRFPALTKCPPQRAMRPATAAHGRMCLAAVHPCLPHGGKKHGPHGKKIHPSPLLAVVSRPFRLLCRVSRHSACFDYFQRIWTTSPNCAPGHAIEDGIFYCEPFNASHLPVFSLFLFRTRRSGMTDRDNHCFP
ncbi:hypothetical protein [uncultured Desulfovibrio sp.]|uniref:hypothetical protein n=1 Tax=uncultured Desulfovibrio sp. TaxID=167968 RepID=UPI002604DB42|nr:hypothetical protein [uncultured Desulfovibrio sp.]